MIARRNFRKPAKKGFWFMNLMYHIVALVVLIAALVGLYLYRRWLENDSHDASIIDTQSNMAKRLDAVDKLKNVALVAVILYAVAIAGMAVYLGWNSNAQG
jgi:hypothetical protein